MLDAMLPRLAAFVVSLTMVIACGLSSQPAPAATPSPNSTGGPTAGASTAATPAPAPSGPQAEIEIQVTGGDHDGSYRAVAQDACVNEPAANTFSVTYADDFAPGGFVALNLVLRDATLAQQDSSNDFRALISLEGAAGGVSYTLDPLDHKGEGDAFLDVSPIDATLDMSVTATDGAIIDLTVICDLG